MLSKFDFIMNKFCLIIYTSCLFILPIIITPLLLNKEYVWSLVFLVFWFLLLMARDVFRDNYLDNKGDFER